MAAKKNPAKPAKEKTEIQQVGEEIVKRKNKNYHNSPVIGDNGYLFEDDDEKKAFTQKILTETMEYWNAEPVRTTEEAEKRTEEYFIRCATKGIKPTVEEYCFALGVRRTTVFRWENGIQGAVDSNVIKKAKEFISIYDARAVMEGKLNPVTYIFRSKNYYGMRDQQDVVVTPNTLESRSREELIKEAEQVVELLPEE